MTRGSGARPGGGPRAAGVSVLIPARNAAVTLGRALAAVAALEQPPQRVAVFDDASTDATARIARAHGIEVLGRGSRVGLGGIRNAGIDWCPTTHLAFLNADCYPRPTWLVELSRAMAATGAAVAGGRQVELRRSTVAERWKARHLRQDLGDRPRDDPDFLSGGNLLLDLDRVGGRRFDDRFLTAYEDVDFCRRVRRGGGRLVYEPGAVVAHDHPERLATLPRKVWSYGASSPSAGTVASLPGALRAFVRVHRRPHDHLRRAVRDDARHGRLHWLALDAYLLATSLALFCQMALVQRKEPHGQRPESDDLPDHHDLQQPVPELRDMEAAPPREGPRA